MRVSEDRDDCPLRASPLALSSAASSRLPSAHAAHAAKVPPGRRRSALSAADEFVHSESTGAPWRRSWWYCSVHSCSNTSPEMKMIHSLDLRIIYDHRPVYQVCLRLAIKGLSDNASLATAVGR